jgi:hypothetical protein
MPKAMGDGALPIWIRHRILQHPSILNMPERLLKNSVIFTIPLLAIRFNFPKIYFAPKLGQKKKT